MFENIVNFFKNINKKEEKKESQESSKDAAKERLHLVLMQDRANVSADFLELMKQEIIDVIKKYIEVDEKEIDVRLTNKENEDGTNGSPALYANIPIMNIKNEARKINKKDVEVIKKEEAQKGKVEIEAEIQKDTKETEIVENIEVEEKIEDKTENKAEENEQEKVEQKDQNKETEKKDKKTKKTVNEEDEKEEEKNKKPAKKEKVKSEE